MTLAAPVDGEGVYFLTPNDMPNHRMSNDLTSSYHDTKILNGKINEHGVILPFNDFMDIIYNKADHSLLYREYKSGNVEASICLAEFEDGEAAAASEIWAGYTGYGSGVHVRDKMNRAEAIEREKKRIIAFLKGVLKDDRSEKPNSTDRNCKKVLEQVYYDAPWCIPSNKSITDKPPALPLDL